MVYNLLSYAPTAAAAWWKRDCFSTKSRHDNVLTTEAKQNAI
jgi:hypothetical protein